MAERFARSLTQQLAEILTNALAGALDDGLERVEDKVQEGLGRIKRARGVAQKRARRGRVTSRTR
jgi:hypothetical protein